MIRKPVLVALLVCAAVCSWTGVAAAQSSGVIYACVGASGNMRMVAASTPCTSKEQRVSWNVTGPRGPAGDVGLPYTATVTCGTDTVMSKINEAGPGVAPVTITINGSCEEDVVITRSDTTLAAGTAGSGVRSVQVNGAKGAVLLHLTLTGGGVSATNGGAFVAEQITVVGAQTAVAVDFGGTGRLYQPTLGCTQSCVAAGNGGSLAIDGGTLQSTTSAGGATVATGGSIQFVNGTVIDGMGLAVYVSPGGTVALSGATIRNSTSNTIINSGFLQMFGTDLVNNAGFGVAVEPGGHAMINGGHISGSALAGISLRGGVLDIEGTVVSGNQAGGIQARNNSSMLVRGVTVENNGQDGIQLGDIAFMEVSGGTTSNVRNNAGYGLVCAPAPAVAHYQVFGGMLSVSGNAGGQINCTMTF